MDNKRMNETRAMHVKKCDELQSFLSEVTRAANADPEVAAPLYAQPKDDKTQEPATADLPEGLGFTDQQAAALGRALAARQQLSRAEWEEVNSGVECDELRRDDAGLYARAIRQLQSENADLKRSRANDEDMKGLVERFENSVGLDALCECDEACNCAINVGTARRALLDAFSAQNARIAELSVSLALARAGIIDLKAEVASLEAKTLTPDEAQVAKRCPMPSTLEDVPVWRTLFGKLSLLANSTKRGPR